MEAKNKKTESTNQPSQITIAVPVNSKVDFNDATLRQQLIEVKNEVKAVLDGAHVDAKKLSLNFTV